MGLSLSVVYTLDLIKKTLFRPALAVILPITPAMMNKNQLSSFDIINNKFYTIQHLEGVSSNTNDS